MDHEPEDSKPKTTSILAVLIIISWILFSLSLDSNILTWLLDR